MATFSDTAPAASLARRAAPHHGGVLRNIVRAYRIWRDYNETRQQLRALSDRQLRDIGVEGDVDAFARSLVELRHR